jgi:ATP-dependent DNA helicase RecG
MASTRKSAEDKTGNTLADKLSRLGITRGPDLVLHLPLRYEDRTQLTPLAAVQAGRSCQVEGTVINTDPVPTASAARVSH